MSSELLVLRRDLYAFLECAYLEHPSKKFVEAFSNGKIPLLDFEDMAVVSDKLSEGFKLLASYKKEIRDAEEAYRSLQNEFTELFIGPMEPKLFPYESFYREGRLFGSSLLQVKEFLRRIGYEKEKSFPEPEDHISFEIAVIRHLCSKQLLLKERREIEESLKLQRRFLDEHLLKWVPSFCKDLYEVAGSKFYKGLAMITEGFISIDPALISLLFEGLE